MANEKVYYLVDEMPEYPGGQEAIKKYFNNHLKDYSEMIIVQIAVDESGKAELIQILNSGSESNKRKAKDLVENMERWSPGKQNGKPVKVLLNYSIKFK